MANTNTVKVNRRDAPFSFTASTLTVTSPVATLPGIANVASTSPVLETVPVPDGELDHHMETVVVANRPEPETRSESGATTTKRPAESTLDVAPDVDVNDTVATPSDTVTVPGR